MADSGQQRNTHYSKAPQTARWNHSIHLKGLPVRLLMFRARSLQFQNAIKTSLTIDWNTGTETTDRSDRLWRSDYNLIYGLRIIAETRNKCGVSFRLESARGIGVVVRSINMINV